MLSVLIAIVVAFGTTGNGHTSPQPQVTILTAPLGETIPLGDLKVQIEDLRAATPADNPDNIPVLVNENLMVIHIVLSNGAIPAYTGIVTYRLQDKNGIGPRARHVRPASLNVQNGTSTHVTGLFTVDKGYAPTSLLVECSLCNAGHYKAVQFTIPTP
jgi:hypothetical protein